MWLASEGQAASEGERIDLQNLGNLNIIEEAAEEVYPPYESE